MLPAQSPSAIPSLRMLEHQVDSAGQAITTSPDLTPNGGSYRKVVPKIVLGQRHDSASQFRSNAKLSMTIVRQIVSFHVPLLLPVFKAGIRMFLL